MTDLIDYAIYLDLDGVMADYAAGMRALGYEIDPTVSQDFNRSGTGHPLKREMFERIKGTDFYRNLPLMEGALDLFAACAEADPFILTAAPTFGAGDDLHANPFWQGAAYHKRAWVEQTLLAQHEWGPYGAYRVPISDDRFICTTTPRKSEFMHRKHSDHQVLIDDRIDNVTTWADNGGIGILHVDAATSMSILDMLKADEQWTRKSPGGGVLFDGENLGYHG